MRTSPYKGQWPSLKCPLFGGFKLNYQYFNLMDLPVHTIPPLVLQRHAPLAPSCCSPGYSLECLQENGYSHGLALEISNFLLKKTHSQQKLAQKIYTMVSKIFIR